MADHFIGTNLGLKYENEDAWTKGTSTGSTDMELRTGDAILWTREKLILALTGLIDQLRSPTNVTATKYPWN